MNEFWTALGEGNQEAVEQAVKDDPSLLSARADNGHSVVRLAWDCGHQNLAEALVQAGAPLSFHDAAALGRTRQVMQGIDARPGRLSEPSHDGYTILHLASFFGHEELCDALLARGAPLEARSVNAMANTPLQAAIAGARSKAVIDRLIESGADVAATAAQGLTVLHLAAARGDGELCQRLMSLGAPQVAMDDGRSPADMAREYGHSALADVLKS